MDWHDQQDLARYRRRKKKQREYQAAYRERLEEAKIPERDDVANELLRVFLMAAIADHRKVSELSIALFDGLEADGYNRPAAITRVRNMMRTARAKLRGSAKGGDS